MSLDNKVELLNIEIKELRGIIAETEKAFANFQEDVNARFKAAQEQTASYELKKGLDYDEERDRLLDIAATLTRGSQHLSHL